MMGTRPFFPLAADPYGRERRYPGQIFGSLAGTRLARFHNDRSRIDDRLGYLSRFGRDLETGGRARLVAGRVAYHWNLDGRGRPQFRRTGRHDASCRWTVRL